MDNDFLASLQKLELLAFFSGYPVIYTVVLFFAGKKKSVSQAVALLPFSYALTGTLFLGFQFRKLYPDYSIENISHHIQLPYLLIWALLSLSFWKPALAKKTSLSLFHGLVFFLLLANDVVTRLLSSSPDNDIVANDMKVYAFSLVLNLGTLAVLVLSFFLRGFFKSLKRDV